MTIQAQLICIRLSICRRNLEENKANADMFENNLVHLTKNIKNSSKDGVDKIEEINWVKDIVEFILHLSTRKKTKNVNTRSNA